MAEEAYSGGLAGLVNCRVCNNALDASPAWEEATESFLDVDHAHTFANASKTASEWAVQAWFTIQAGSATGPVEVRSVTIGVSP